MTPHDNDLLRSRPVGFFDSGRGGETIRSAFLRLCPDEDTRYIADSANCPYGNKPAEEIRRLSTAAARRLIEEDGCKMVVVACNTATAAAIDHLRATWPEIPFVGLEPAVKPAALHSRTGVVGVLATQGTFNGRLYNETKARFAKDVTVIATVADELVTLVEEGKEASADAEDAVRRRLEPLLAAGADQIVLGCTHFPHLRPLMEYIAAGRAEIVDSCNAVALQALRVLKKRKLNARRTVLVTGGTVRLGLAIANACRAQGWLVATSSHRADAGADIVADLAAEGGAERLFEEARRFFGGHAPGVVVSNAALYTGAPADETWRVNYEASPAFASLMRGRGRVIAILDRHLGRHAGTPYAESKAALAAWTRAHPEIAAGVTAGDILDLAPVNRREKAVLAHGEKRETAAQVAARVVKAIEPV